jgi:hypothetical protein
MDDPLEGDAFVDEELADAHAPSAIVSAVPSSACLIMLRV